MATLSVADARASFSKLVEAATSTHERFEVTRNGDRVVVMLSADDYDSLLETLDILGDAAEVRAIQDGIRALERGETYSADDVRQAMRDRPAP
jgi:prevent-host-death family protein